MSNRKERPEEMRERLRQEELKNTSSSVQGNNLADLVGRLGWKAVGILILIIFIAFSLYFLFFR